MRQLPLWSKTAVSVATGDAVAPSEPPSRVLVLTRLLSERAQRPVELVFTTNRSTMLSCRVRDGVLRVRLHQRFLEADHEVHVALGDYLAGRARGGAGKILDRFIAQIAPARDRAPSPTQPVGRFHDLAAIWREQNARFFHDASEARITWGQASGRRYRRTIQLGCYVAEEKLIRIHPALDQAFVPRHYVAWIVFHEMLHEVFGVEQRGGRRCVHPPEFAAVEQSHPDYLRCKKWEAENIHRLLRFRG